MLIHQMSTHDVAQFTLTLPQRPLITLNQKTGIKTAKTEESLFQLPADSGSLPREASGFSMGRAWTNIAYRTAAELSLMSCSCWVSRPACLQTNTWETN